MATQRNPHSREAVGQRMRDWGLSHYPSLKAFADALSMAQVNLSSYLAGRSFPGNVIQSRLRTLGMDIDWLMTGVAADPNKTLTSTLQYIVHASVPHSRDPKAVTQGPRAGIECDAHTHVWVKPGEAARSMFPVLHPHDYLLINLEDEPRTNDLIVLRYAKNTIAVGLAVVSNEALIVRGLGSDAPLVLPPDTLAFRVVVIKHSR